MRVKVEAYADQGRELWAYSLVAGRKDYVISSANGYVSAAAARSAGDALLVSLARRAAAKQVTGRPVR